MYLQCERNGVCMNAALTSNPVKNIFSCAARASTDFSPSVDGVGDETPLLFAFVDAKSLTTILDRTPSCPSMILWVVTHRDVNTFVLCFAQNV